MDYAMSIDFGLDWKRNDWRRMRTFINIKSLINSNDNRKG